MIGTRERRILSIFGIVHDIRSARRQARTRRRGTLKGRRDLSLATLMT